MARLSLTDFVDVVGRAGTPKLTKIRELKRRGAYEPAKDFYRPLRLRLIEMHRDGLPKKHLKVLLVGLADRKKQSTYPHVMDGYLGWMGRKQISWTEPPSATWKCGRVEVSVNPELGLSWGKGLTFVKLYFKAEPLSKRRVEVILHLMESVLGNRFADSRFGVLDVRRGRLVEPTVAVGGIDAMLKGEAAYIEAVWDSV